MWSFSTKSINNESASWYLKEKGKWTSNRREVVSSWWDQGRLRGPSTRPWKWAKPSQIHMAKSCSYLLSLAPHLLLSGRHGDSLWSLSTCSYLHSSKANGQLLVLPLTELSMALDWVYLSFWKDFLVLAYGILHCSPDFLCALVAIVSSFLCCNLLLQFSEFWCASEVSIQTSTHTISIGHWSLSLVAH